MEENLYHLLKSFLHKEHFIFNSDELYLQLLSHPSYPSLHSITGVLDHFGIDNMALDVPRDKVTFDQLPVQFLGYIELDGSKQFCLVAKQASGVRLLLENKKKQTFTVEEFLAIWQGIIVVVENDKNVVVKKRINHRLVFLLITGLLFLGYTFYTNANFYAFLNLLLSFTGIYISALIVQQELGYSSRTLQKVCGNTDTTSCNAVLNSAGALLFGKFKLSDLSLIYFTGISIYWVLYLFNVVSINTSFVVLTFLALPITLYSIYYQFIIVKKWCTLCLGIIATLWLQCCTILLNDVSLRSMEFDARESFILFFSLIISISVWLYVRPLLEKQKSLNDLTIEHYKFKKHYNIFTTLLDTGSQINDFLISPEEIILGNKSAPISLLLVTNPSCFYCKEAHRDIEALLEKSKEYLRVIIRFNVPRDSNNTTTQVAARLIEMYNTKHELEVKDALDEAYDSDVDFKKWLSKWGTASNDLYLLLDKQREWCHTNAIHFTPALFVNGKEYPREYEREDLLFFIEDMVEELESKKVVVK